MRHVMQYDNAADHEEIGRVARRLWQRAGWPPGRYIEFWTKVEEALAEARHEQSCKPLMARRSPQTSSPEESVFDALTRSVATTVWEQTGWKPLALSNSNENGDTPAARPAVHPASSHDR